MRNRLAGSLQGANLRVPNNEDQQAAGQRQRQEVRHDQESIFWQHNWSPNTLGDLAYFRNFFRSELISSPFDTPLTANQNRHQTRQGIAGQPDPRNSRSHHQRPEQKFHGFPSRSFLALRSLIPTQLKKRASAMPPWHSLPITPSPSPTMLAAGRKRCTPRMISLPCATSRSVPGCATTTRIYLVSINRWSPRIGAIYYLPKTRK